MRELLDKKKTHTQYMVDSRSEQTYRRPSERGEHTEGILGETST
jgi:hypothetical protein